MVLIRYGVCAENRELGAHLINRCDMGNPHVYSHPVSFDMCTVRASPGICMSFGWQKLIGVGLVFQLKAPREIG